MRKIALIILGILVGLAVVTLVIIFAISENGFSSVFCSKTYRMNYVSGMYMPDGYKSSFLGYKFTLPEGYELSDMEERAKYSGSVYKNISLSDMEDNLENQTDIIDMWVISTEKEDTGYVANTMVSVKREETVSQKVFDKYMEHVVQCYNEMGMNIQNGYEVTEFLGKKCGKYLATATMDGVKVNQIGYVFVENGYAWFLMVSYREGMQEEAQKLLDAYDIYE